MNSFAMNCGWVRDKKICGPPRLFADVVNIGADTVAILEMLARQRLVAAQNRLGAAQLDRHIAVFDALDDAVGDLADAILIFAELALTLGVAYALDDDLLGHLRGNAAEIDRRQILDQEFADRHARFFILGIGQRQLGDLILDGLRDFAEPLQRDFAGAAIDRRANIVLMTVFGASGLLDGLLHRLDHLFAVDILFARDLVGDLQQLDHSRPLSMKRRRICLTHNGRRCGTLVFDGGDQPVGQNQFRAFDLRQGQGCRTVFTVEQQIIAFDRGHRALEALAAIDRRIHFQFHVMPHEALVIGAFHQRTVDAGRADFQHIFVGNRVGFVENERNRTRQPGAILHQHGRAVAPFRHDLKCRTPCAALHLDANQLIAEFVRDRRDEFFDLFAQIRSLKPTHA